MKIDWYQNLYTYWHVWSKYVQSKWTTLFLNPTVKFMVQGCPIHEINISYLLWLTSNGNKVVQFWKLLLQSAISLNHILSLKLVWKYINHYSSSSCIHFINLQKKFLPLWTTTCKYSSVRIMLLQIGCMFSLLHIPVLTNHVHVLHVNTNQSMP